MSRDVPCPKESKSTFKRSFALCARGSAGSYVSGKPLLPFCQQEFCREPLKDGSLGSQRYRGGVVRYDNMILHQVEHSLLMAP